jgi:hypothetical protein
MENRPDNIVSGRFFSARRSLWVVFRNPLFLWDARWFFNVKGVLINRVGFHGLMLNFLFTTGLFVTCFISEENV